MSPLVKTQNVRLYITLEINAVSLYRTCSNIYAVLVHNQREGKTFNFCLLIYK